jgi:integrase/recombinase XerD
MDDPIKKMLIEMQIRGFTETSQTEYVKCIRIFQKFYRKPVTEVTEEEIKVFLHHLVAERKMAANSVNLFNAALKFLYQKTLKRFWNSENLPRLKKPKKLPAVLTKEEVQLLFDVTDNLKHKCILMTVYGSGLRLSEIVGLKAGDIDSKNMRIFIRQGKGKKDRYAILSEKSLNILREYWKVYKPKDWLFEGMEEGSHLTRRSTQDVFKKALKKAGIRKKVSIHSLRHYVERFVMWSELNLALIFTGFCRNHST